MLLRFHDCFQWFIVFNTKQHVYPKFIIFILFLIIIETINLISFYL